MNAFYLGVDEEEDREDEDDEEEDEEGQRMDCKWNRQAQSWDDKFNNDSNRSLCCCCPSFSREPSFSFSSLTTTTMERIMQRCCRSTRNIPIQLTESHSEWNESRGWLTVSGTEDNMIALSRQTARQETVTVGVASRPSPTFLLLPLRLIIRSVPAQCE